MRWHLNRMWRPFFLSAILFLMSACAAPAQVKSGSYIQDVQLSPEGDMVAFQFCNRKVKRCGIGLFDVRTETLTRIPSPPGTDLGHPSFSYDGKKLAASLFCQENCTAEEKTTSHIVVIDIETLSMTQVTQGSGLPVKRGRAGIRKYPVFQPGIDNILFVTQAVYPGGGIFQYGLALVDMKDGTETILIDPADGFRLAIFRPSFVGADEIRFTAMSPIAAELRATVKTTYKDHENMPLPYQHRFGETPEIISPYPELKQGPLMDIKIAELEPVSSHNGKRTVFTYQSSIIPTEIGKGFNYEIYLHENGKTKQVTDLRAYMSFIAISHKGRYVMFGMDNTRGMNFEFYILDLDTGRATSTGLRDLVANDPALTLE
ncbi:MAG: hypothetical protein HQL45_04165 [Alphaproteobacteria bacterium]|nr:hypothetical protein [Alphaproteobacteria bacterium]